MRSLSETGGVSLAVALGESGGESFAALQAMARSERVPDRIAATAGLRRLAIHDSAAGEILTKLLSDEDRRVRNRSARVLGELGASSEAAVEVLTDWLQTGELDEQRLALQVLGSFGPSAAVSIKKVVSCLDNPRLADDAASTLGRMAPSSLSELASRLGHEATRPQAIRALGVAGAEARDVAPALVELLRLGDQLVACETAAALWRMGVESQKAFDVLMDGCGGSALEALAFPPLDRTPPREEILAGFRLAKVRAQCIRAAIRMGPRMVPALISGLEEKDVMVRRSACRALATAARDLDTAVEGLLRAARDPDEQVRSYAAHGLRTVGVTCDDRLEVEVWSAIEAEASEGVKVALIGALGRSGCGSNVTISRLESMLDAESGPIRKEALNVLVALQAGARVRIERQNRAGVDPTP
jgi:HEAT repeat protein